LYEEDLRKKIWTCFEFSVMNHSDLMQDHHLDQILMCGVYVIFKVISSLYFKFLFRVISSLFLSSASFGCNLSVFYCEFFYMYTNLQIFLCIQTIYIHFLKRNLNIPKVNANLFSKSLFVHESISY
jgi:hypothetical protein